MMTPKFRFFLQVFTCLCEKVFILVSVGFRRCCHCRDFPYFVFAVLAGVYFRFLSVRFLEDYSQYFVPLRTIKSTARFS